MNVLAYGKTLRYICSHSTLQFLFSQFAFLFIGNNFSLVVSGAFRFSVTQRATESKNPIAKTEFLTDFGQLANMLMHPVNVL